MPTGCSSRTHTNTHVIKEENFHNLVSSNNDSKKPTPFDDEQYRLWLLDKREDKTLAVLLVELEEVEEQMDNLQQLRLDLMEEIVAIKQQASYEDF
ncbi:hypothetical protein H6G89_26310 [Oscillatoria sp. FACHB-1407]|uniref:hypothetical protein n=1 Tax=Oscillatoria sp. FACHB-1407 TaxID=2692847 RepID=UPI0016897406|nr:hypothetical protein [Oscillatoria sp. FACHB-1407]MBD2464524.1 hypothetical protein [Oscillatoria sp. FACHB-1407]